MSAHETPLDIALAHLRRFPTDYLFPLAKLSKHPPLLKKNLTENCSCDPDQLRVWARTYRGCNWGIALRRSRLIVADVDTSRSKPGRATFELLDMLHEWPKTSCVRTPSNGFHLYYSGQHVMRVNGFGAAVDSPNYVVLPGMQVMSGGFYRFTNDRPRAEAPRWFYEFLAPKERVTDPSTAVVDLDQEPNIAWAVDHLRNDALPAIEGQGGELRTMLTAMTLRDHGISEEMARDLMLEHYNEQKCSPSWDLEGLTKKIANGYAYASLRQPGGSTAEADFGDDPPPAVTPHGPQLVTIHGRTFPVVRNRRARPRKRKGHSNAK